MRYQVIGIGSGFFAHILTTLVASWRRVLRSSALAGALAFLAAEGIALGATHRFPPGVPTHLAAGALALALAYGTAATIFADELIRGALRALHILQGEARARMGAEAGMPIPAPPPAAASDAPPTPLPLAPSRPARVFGPDMPSAPRVPASRPLLAAAAAEEPQPGEDAPTLPVTIWEEDSATVLLLPSPPIYDPAAAGAFPPRYPSYPSMPGRPDAAAYTPPPPLPDRYDLLRRYAPAAPLGALPPLAPSAAPGAGGVAAIIPAAPWAQRRRRSPFGHR